MRRVLRHVFGSKPAPPDLPQMQGKEEVLLSRRTQAQRPAHSTRASVEVCAAVRGEVPLAICGLLVLNLSHIHVKLCGERVLAFIYQMGSQHANASKE